MYLDCFFYFGWVLKSKKIEGCFPIFDIGSTKLLGTKRTFVNLMQNHIGLII